MHESQLNDRVDDIIQANKKPKKVIKSVFNDLGLLDKDFKELLIIQNINLNNLQNGFIPTTAMVYLSDSGVYNALSSELSKIKKTWKRKK